MIVPLRQTGTADASAWVRRVFPEAVGIMTAAVDLSAQYDDSSEGLTDAAALHHAMAVCVVAHLGVACNWGALEFNHNPGLAPCVTGGDCAEVPATGATAASSLASFATLRDGVAGWVAWVQRASSRGWEMLGQGSVGFWPFFDRDARIAGTPTAAEAVAACNRVAALVGEPAIAGPEAEVAADDWREAGRGAPATPRPPRPAPGGGGGGGGGGGAPRPAPPSSGSSAGPFALLALGWGLWFALRSR